MTDHLKSAPVAYETEQFLNSPDGRILRILAEYQEPLARFRREQIQDTVVSLVPPAFRSAESPRRTSLPSASQVGEAVQLEQELKRAEPASIWPATTKTRANSRTC